MHSKNFPNLFWRKNLWNSTAEVKISKISLLEIVQLGSKVWPDQDSSLKTSGKKLVKLHCYKSLLLSKKGATGSFWIFVSRQNLDKIFNIKERIGESNVWRQFEDNWTIELVRLLIIYMSAIRYLLHKWNQFLFLLYLCWINLWFCRIKFVRLFYLQ